MPRCPITYEEIAPDLRYSKRGLAALSGKLETLLPFPYNLEEQLQLASEMAAKISIQGVQPKLSVSLQVEEGSFIVVEKGGPYILKPQNPLFSHLPENEDLTMKLASLAGLDVPLHGLAWARDGSLFYFIKRFDRLEKGRKLAVEDFAQLAGLSRETKYAYSIEKLITLIDSYMTFPVIEKAKLFRLFLFNFLTGNEDAHLKNYSVIDLEGKRQLSPCYDLLNSTLVLSGGVPEESALPLGGKKRNLTRNDIFRYLARERLRLPGKAIDSTAEVLKEALPQWEKTIETSFLLPEQKEGYWNIVSRRAERVFGG